ncbi:MAG: four helix bundle protein [Verrucomicrobiota bacterium]
MIQSKSFDFAVRAVKLAKHLQEEKKEFVISKQVLRSGTAIGALIREAEHAESRADFAHKMNIALKESNETLYWLDLLHHSSYIEKSSFTSIHSDCTELVKILVSIVKTSKNKVAPRTSS